MENNKFKLFDIVRIKSYQWWEENKYFESDFGEYIVRENNCYDFSTEMSAWCGSLAIIMKVDIEEEEDVYSVIVLDPEYDIIGGENFVWMNFMFEDKPVLRISEEEYKILPFGKLYIISTLDGCIPEFFETIEDANNRISKIIASKI